MNITLPVGASFDDIPRLPRAHYTVDFDWHYLEEQLRHQQDELGLDLDPDFQRGHVWTEEQQVSYVEYILQGGEAAKTLIAVSVNWEAYPPTSYALLDGKQRLTAVLRFLRNEIRAFGRLRSEFKGRLRCTTARFEWRVIEVKDRADVLRAYLTFNGGGVVHSPAELERVRKLLEVESKK
jgi:hypothetical protein